MRGCTGPPGWGDKLVWLLAHVPFFPITKESYRRWKVRNGFADACNCGERAEALNRFGRAVGKRLRATWRRIRAWLQR